ncbi:MAG TPA: RNA pseudouridine synthase, partial [Methylophaga sp.]|nr:RNA pseudouridine synthase [Methylophaga sp.]
MTEIIKLDATIPESLTGLRVDQALAQLFSEYSRGQLTKWIKAGDVLLNQQTCRPKDAVRTGDQIEIAAQQIIHDDNWQAESIALDIIYEDDDV